MKTIKLWKLMVIFFGLALCAIDTADAEIIQVPAYATPTVTSETVLQEGQLYVIEVTGTYIWWGTGQTPADAEWYDNTTGNWVETHVDLEYWGDLLVNGLPQDWMGTVDGINFAPHVYSPSHVYRIFWLGTGQPLTFKIEDWTGANTLDNSGSLEVEITVVEPAVIYVDVDATGNNDGSSWEDAFNYLQDALAVAQYGDEIWVAEGTYKPDQGVSVSAGDRTATFKLINGVTIKGGFAGISESDPDARDYELYETVLSGDIGTSDNSSDNSYHVVTGTWTDSTAVLEGFTVTQGYANGSWPYSHGGGMFNTSGSPTVNNCRFMVNTVTDGGGGMYNWNNSNPQVSDCTFTGNSSGDAGGGMVNQLNSSPVLSDCIFNGNTAYSEGGGIYNNESSSPTINDCIFNGNITESLWGGGVRNGADCNPTLTNCTFSGNSAFAYGGGIYNKGNSPKLVNCTFRTNSVDAHGAAMYNEDSNPLIVNCIFIGNAAYHDGGGIFNERSNPTLTNCTFSGNTSGDEGGAICNIAYSGTILKNCILWGDTAGTWGNEIYLSNYYGASSMTISYSDVEGGSPGIYVEPGCTLLWDDISNIDSDPLFVDTSNADLHLLLNSPCIDAGDNAAVERMAWFIQTRSRTPSELVCSVCRVCLCC